MNLSSSIQNLYAYINKHHVLQDITYNSYDFFDEPHIPFYHATFNSIVKKHLLDSGFISDTQGLSASGISFQDKNLALFKCLMETLERFCLFTYIEEKTYKSSYVDLKQEAITPQAFIQQKNIEEQQLGWVKGRDILQQKEILIPAQLAYINYYSHNPHEQVLGQFISTGAASGFQQEDILLRGIYEVIERDAIMSIYLNQIAPEQVSMVSLSTDILQKIEYLHKYRLTPHIFYIKNDLDIPTILTVLTDESPIGPKIAIGSKSSLQLKDAVLGSIEEAVMTRHSMRKNMQNGLSQNMSINIQDIVTIEKRSLYWSKNGAKQMLSFLFKNKNEIHKKGITQLEEGTGTKQEFEIVIEKLKQNKYQIMYADITLPQIKKELGVSVYKVIIPHMQPLYLNEQEKEYQMTRLKIFAAMYKKKTLSINPIPHPFL